MPPFIGRIHELFRRENLCCQGATLMFGLLAATSTLAQTGGPADADRMFQSLDTNRDGRLSMEDSQGNNRYLMTQIFEMAKKSSTESLSREDFQKVFDQHQRGQGGGSPPPAENPGSPSGNMQRSEPPVNDRREEDDPWQAVARWCDANGDGRITRAEWNRLTQLWIRVDADKDNRLSPQEIQSISSTAAGMVERPSSGDADERPAPAAPGRPDRRAGNALEGTWRGSISGDGERHMEIELTVAGNRMSGRELRGGRPAQDMGTGSYSFTGENSGNLDAEGLTGREEGRHFLGIYELSGDTLRWCVSNRGRQRPQIMSTDRGNYVLVLQRVR
jgi:uncharacterized protein (TIGR03067 family)